jgi:hypothetical protein
MVSQTVRFRRRKRFAKFASINNPFSAENEFPGWNGIEIYTQPGADKWHGAFAFDFNDESLNSRNPFTSTRAPYQQRGYRVKLSGPIGA